MLDYDWLALEGDVGLRLSVLIVLTIQQKDSEFVHRFGGTEISPHSRVLSIVSFRMCLVSRPPVEPFRAWFCAVFFSSRHVALSVSRAMEEKARHNRAHISLLLSSSKIGRRTSPLVCD